MSLFTISVIKIAALVIKGIESSQLSPGLTEILLAGSGEVDASHSGISEVKPILSFSTTDIKSALVAFGGQNGTPIVPTTAEFLFWLQKSDAGGVRTAGANHIKATSTVGIVIPQTLTMPSGGQASISYQAIFLSPDGAALPVIFTGSQALDAGQAGADDAYILGPVVLNGATIENVSEVTYDFGLTLFEGIANPYMTEIAINSRRPKFSITCNDVEETTGWGLLGQAQDATDSIISLYPVSEGAVPTASGALTFTIDQGVMSFDGVGGQHGEKASATIMLTPTFDGVADTVAIGGLV